VVRENLLTLYAAVEQGFASALPSFVRDELECYVACGVLSRGFAVFAVRAANSEGWSRSAAAGAGSVLRAWAGAWRKVLPTGSITFCRKKLRSVSLC
jgi:hypothetical protein